MLQNIKRNLALAEGLGNSGEHRGQREARGAPTPATETPQFAFSVCPLLLSGFYSQKNIPCPMGTDRGRLFLHLEETSCVFTSGYPQGWVCRGWRQRHEHVAEQTKQPQSSSSAVGRAHGRYHIPLGTRLSLLDGAHLPRGGCTQRLAPSGECETNTGVAL